ncbi:uncharacterized protein [Antedon mediterranea]|uniref:uncharacterized protein n=1 Tax=Antedon mediterranea TaxID=105859 RepID=UPI003AF8CC82
MLKPTSSLVFSERPTRYVNGVRKKEHHLKPLLPVVASHAVTSERRQTRPEGLKPAASSPNNATISGPRKTKSAGSDRRKKTEVINEKRAFSSTTRSSKNSNNSRSKRGCRTEANDTRLNPDIEYGGWVDETSDILFIDSKSASTRPSEGTVTHGKILPKDLLIQCQESEYDSIYDINLHACHIKKIHNLEKFRKVKILDLSCNEIEQIEHLSSNTNLKELKLYGNKISEIKNLEKLTELCILQLQFNKLKSLGKGLLSAKKLKCLRVDNNHLTQIEAREIAAFSQLTNLDVSCNKLQNLSVFNCLNSLEELLASNNILKTVTDLSRCRKLQELNLSSNSLTSISGLKGLPLLASLHLSHNLLTSEAVQGLGKLRSLQELDLSHNKISKLNSFSSQFPVIEVLNLTKNSIEWLEVVHLSSCEFLVELFLAENPFIKSSDFKPSYHEEVHRCISGIEMVDGVIVKQTKQKPVPFMRPMSAASGLSAKQVQSQLQTVEADLNMFGQDLREKFENLRTTMDTLPAERPISVASELSITSVSTLASSRPGSSRCSSRSRLQDAKAYATTHFK